MSGVARAIQYSPTDAPVPEGRYNATAIAAFVVVFFVSVVGLVLGYVALGQIKRTQDRGRALAVAAVVLGWVGTVGFLLVLGLAVVGSWVFKLY